MPRAKPSPAVEVEDNTADELVKIKVTVNVTDHEGVKIPKGEIAVLKRAFATDLYNAGKAVRVDPIPAEGE